MYSIDVTECSGQIKEKHIRTDFIDFVLRNQKNGTTNLGTIEIVKTG